MQLLQFPSKAKRPFVGSPATSSPGTASKGASKKKEERKPRSPFRKATFEARHSTSIAFGEKMDERLSKLEHSVGDLRNDSINKDILLAEQKIRISILEKKQKTKSRPNVSNVNDLLEYFDLDEKATIDEIRNIINTRILEVSPESLISSAVNDDMNEEERDAEVTYLNQALGVLTKWKFEQNNQ